MTLSTISSGSFENNKGMKFESNREINLNYLTKKILKQYQSEKKKY